MSEITLREFLNESKLTYDELEDNNVGRKGKLVMNSKGKEQRGTMYLGNGVYAKKGRMGIQLIDTSGKQTIMIDPEAAKQLSNLK